MTQQILMTRDNPDGHKLEDLLSQLQTEISAKNANLLNDKSPLSIAVQDNNLTILKLLSLAEGLQRKSYELMTKKAPDEGALGKPRFSIKD